MVSGYSMKAMIRLASSQPIPPEVDRGTHSKTARRQPLRRHLHVEYSCPAALMIG
jgi:hypothetical protein